MKKSIIPVLVALLITACVGVSMFAIGGAALLNKNGVPISGAPAQGSDAPGLNSPRSVGQVEQMQTLISQYQDHEQQYQQREQQLQDQLSQANIQIQQFQNLLAALQQRGVIRITNDGRVFINQ